MQIPDFLSEENKFDQIGKFQKLTFPKFNTFFSSFFVLFIFQEICKQFAELPTKNDLAKS